MNLNQLKIFYYAAKNGNLSRAANELFITQPAVTKGIQRLQEHYEIKFVDFVGKKLMLTDAGEVLYQIAEKIFEMEKQAEESIRDFQQRKRGQIKILSSESFGDYYLPSIIISFSKVYPLIQVSMNILPTELVVEKTASLNCDLGFISYPVEHKRLSVKEILTDKLVIIMAPDHPLTHKKSLKPKDLAGQNFIMHEKGSAPRQAIEELIRKNNISIGIPLELSSNRAIKRAVEERTGIALISIKVANEEIRAKRLRAVDLTDPSMTRKFFLIHHKDKYISESLKLMMDMVFSWTSDYAKKLS